MSAVQYKKVVPWDVTLVDVGFTDTDISSGLKGLAESAIKITTGAPNTNAGMFIPGAIIQNSVDGVNYINSGTTASPVWSISNNSGLNGDITVNAAGLATLAQNVRQSWVKVSLTAAQIKLANTTPVALIAAQGIGTIVHPIKIIARLNFITPAYATNTTLNVGFVAGSDPLFTTTSLLTTSAGNPIQPMFEVLQGSVVTNDNEYITNASLNVSVPTGNPTAGNGTLDIYVLYEVITL